MKYFKYYLLTIIITLIDQASKLLVHFNMEMGDPGEIKALGEWFRLHYLLNPGMAFGLEFDFIYGKLFLTLFRVFATFGIGYYLFIQIKSQLHRGFLICLAIILGGTIGNVIDSVFYGVFIEGNVIENAITPWFHGQVIDMLYFPIFDGYLPDWIPFWGGGYFLFFSPVFNIADSSIFVGIFSIILFQRKFFNFDNSPKEVEENTETAVS